MPLTLPIEYTSVGEIRAAEFLAKLDPSTLPLTNDSVPKSHSGDAYLSGGAYRYKTSLDDTVRLRCFDAGGNEIGTMWTGKDGTLYFAGADGSSYFYFDSRTGRWVPHDVFRTDAHDYSCLHLPGSDDASSLGRTAQLAGGESAPTTTPPRTTASTSGSPNTVPKDNGSPRTPSINDSKPSVRTDIPQPPIFVPHPPATAPTAPIVSLPQPTTISFATLQDTSGLVRASNPTPPLAATAAVPVADEGRAVQPTKVPTHAPQICTGGAICFTQVVEGEPAVDPRATHVIVEVDAAHQPGVSAGVTDRLQGEAVAQSGGVISGDNSLCNPLQVNDGSVDCRARATIASVEVDAQLNPSSGSPVTVVMGLAGDAADPTRNNAPALPTPFTPFGSGSAMGAAFATDGRERYVAVVDNHPDNSHGDEGGNGKGGNDEGSDGGEEERGQS